MESSDMPDLELGAEFLTALGQWLPKLAAALFLLLLGWLLARLLRTLAVRLVQGTEHWLGKLGHKAGDSGRRWSAGGVQLLPKLVYWVVLIAFVGLASGVLGITLFSRWIDTLLLYLPTLFVGVAIVLAGVVLGELTRGLTVAAGHAGGVIYAEALGRLVQLGVIVSALLIGASQIGIDVTLLENLATVALAAVLGAFALAFGLATPKHIGNFISSRYVRRHFRAGDRLSIGEYSGRIVDITPHAVIIDTERGELHIPAQRFNEEPCLKLSDEA